MPRKRRAVPLALLSALALAAGASATVLYTVAGDRGPQLVQREPVDAPPVLPASSPRPGAAGPTVRGAIADALRSDALRSPALRSRAAAMVTDPSSERTLLRHRADVPTTPASTTKLLTATAALTALGPDARLSTEVVRGSQSGPPASVVLVGGGDPTLASPAADGTYPQPAQLGRLAKQTAGALRASGATAVRVRYDATLFSGSVTAPSWKPDYVPSGYVAPVTALAVDSGRVRPDSAERVEDPPQVAARTFARLLEQRGISVRGEVVEQAAASGAKRLAAVRSPPLSALVERMLTRSDNDLAEALGRHVALAVGEPASFRGAAAAIEQVLTRLDVPTGGVYLYDCSGLSHRNKATAQALVQVLARAVSSEHPELRSVATGLPVAGFSGTLALRYEDRPVAGAAGYVRAKTGTLTGVSSLAGIAYRPDGRMVIFALLADHASTGGSADIEAAWDRAAATLATRGLRMRTQSN